MPWCPKCRNEYVEGITKCVDCEVDLVDELPEEVDLDAPYVICHVDNEELAIKIVTYIKYAGLITAGAVTTEDEDSGYDIIIANFEKEKLLDTIEDVEKFESMSEDEILKLLPSIEDELKDLEDEEANIMFSELRSESSTIYVKQKEKYNDMKFSGIAFTFFGIVGLIFLALNVFKVIHILNMNYFSLTVIALVFVVFIGIGISSAIKAKKIKATVSEEEAQTEEITNWIDENITDDYIKTLVDEEESEEVNYFNAHSAMCEKVATNFPDIDITYVEQLMDERYNTFCE